MTDQRNGSGYSDRGNYSDRDDNRFGGSSQRGGSGQSYGWERDDRYEQRGFRSGNDADFGGGTGIGGGSYSRNQDQYRSAQDRYSQGGYGRDQRGGNDRGWMDRAGDEVRSWFGDDDADRRREMDQHQGKGPKGYTRSDDRIREDVSDRLSDDPRTDASDIEVTVANGEVTLSGTVTDRQSKRSAEDCVDRVSGVQHVQNNLRVKQSGSKQSTTSADNTSQTAKATTA